MKADSPLTCERLPNPFHEGDMARDRLKQCEREIEALKRSNSLLMQSVTMLMQMCNKKLAASAKTPPAKD